MVGVVLLTGCRHDVKHSDDIYTYRFQGDVVEILDQDLANNLEVQEINVFPYSKTVVTAGKVRPIPTQYAAVASPFAGRIIKSYVQMGQLVKKGTPLFEIICPDFIAAQKDFFQAQSNKELALKDLRRKEDLIKNGVSSQKELEEAQNSLLIAEKDFENAQEALQVYQVEDLVSMSLGQALVVKAPITGLLIENNIVSGQYVKEDDDPVAVVADLSSVWVAAQVKEKDIRFINENGTMEISVAALPGRTIMGDIFHIEEEVDEDTRAIQVLSKCSNKDQSLKLGMYVTVKFTGDPIDMIEIPETALLQGVDDSFVYVKTSPTSYVVRPVKVETTRNGMAVISAGLKAGEKVITKGGYYLKK